MTHEEFKHLCAYSKAQRNRFIPSRRVTSRRSAKGIGKAIGQVLKNSRVQGEVSLEKDMNPLFVRAMQGGRV